MKLVILLALGEAALEPHLHLHTAAGADSYQGLRDDEAMPTDAQLKLLRGVLGPYFSKYDADNSNHIEANELGRVFQEMNEPKSTQEIKELFRAYDRDRNGKLTLDEFCAGMLKYAAEKKNDPSVHRNATVAHDSDEEYEEIPDEVAENKTLASPRDHNLTIREHKCGHRGEYSFRSWAPMPVEENELFSVVQHCPPPCSLASHCDWVVGSRYETWRHLPPFTAWGDPDTLPRTIFVQTDELQTFSESLLRCIPRSHRVVLITGDHDKTTPLQLDRRYQRVFKPGTWESWLADERISHIFVEHLDAPAGPFDKVSPIPTGMNPDDPIGPDPLAAAPRRVQIRSLPLRAVDIGRQRPGSQFEERHRVRQLCNSSRWPWCDAAYTRKEDFLGVLKKYPFVLCVHGGGIDPNPKLFSAIIAGAIPIMRDYPGAVMYDNWPVVRVRSWTDINPSRLAQWRELHARAFEDERLRNRTLHRLTMRHWWSKIMARVHGRDARTRPSG